MYQSRAYEPELNSETIDRVIEETKCKQDELAEECYHKSAYSDPYARSLRHLKEAKEFLNNGYKVEWHEQGLLVDNWFVVATKARKWRAKNKNKWYRYSAKSLLKILDNQRWRSGNG